MKQTVTVLSLALSATFGHSAILLHLDANDLALADGDPVSNWGSLSAAGAAQPTYRATGMNGNPSVDFDGASNFMGGGALAGARSVLAVTTLDTGAVSLAGLFSNDNDRLNIRRNNNFNFYRSVGQNGDNNDFYRHGNHVGADNVYVDGVASGSFIFDQSHTLLANAGADANFTNFTIGRAAASGGAAGRWWNGDVSEVYVFDETLTADEIAGVSSILADRWGSTAVTASPAQIAAGNAVLGIPEPSALSLFGLAGLGLILRRRRI